ncbi:MAG TPA: class I SAM-dependent methyltransferase [Actinomycetota bacterium]
MDGAVGRWTNEGIKVRDAVTCMVCGHRGKVLYSNVRDRLFDVPGVWDIRHCERCGLYWLDPRPLDSEVPKLYGTYYTHDAVDGDGLDIKPARSSDPLLRKIRLLIRDGYIGGHYTDRCRGWNLSNIAGLLAYLSPRRRAAVDRLFFFLPPRRAGRLLEVGFGAGHALRALQELGWRVEGIEVDPVAVERAAARGLNVRLGRLEEASYPEATFDAIVTSHVVEHLTDPLSFLTEARRILKPGGALVSVTPNPSSLAHRVFGQSWLHLDPPRHLYLFPVSVLRALVPQAGFTEVHARTITGGAVETLARSQVIRETGKSALDSDPSSLRPWWARAWAIVEELFVRVGGDVGEEIVLIARR